MDIRKINTHHSRGTSVQYFCQGESRSTNLVLRQGNANKPVKDVCKSREIRIAFNQVPGMFEINTETMVEYHSKPGRANMPEMLSPFLTSHNLKPTWKNAHGFWGSYDQETGLWNGIVALVSKISIQHVGTDLQNQRQNCKFLFLV